jgi:hypothetical protein
MKQKKVHDEIQRRTNSGNPSYFSDRKLLSPCLLYKTLNEVQNNSFASRFACAWNG